MQTYHSPEITELAKALIEVQKTLIPAVKDASNSFTKSNYATLNSVMGVCREALLANGIWLTQLPMPAPPEISAGHIALLTKFTHAKSGQWQSSFIVAPLPKNDPQGMGSALTYCRRYALTAMLGMVTEDDDGEAARMPSQKPTTQKPLNQKPSAHKSSLPNPHITPQATHSQYSSNDYSHMPYIDGINYQHVVATDGRPCVVASGKTQAKKELLKAAGFQWNVQRKMWWKYVDSA